MGAGEINFLALPVAAVIALVGAPLALRRAAFPWGKVVFGSLAVLFSALGVVGVVISVQHKTGLSDLPLAWLAVPALLYALLRISRFKPDLHD